jgi:hypothetical protein
MIPNPVDIGSIWKVLPAGMHDATLEEVKDRFATNDHRRALFQGLVQGIDSLRQAGCLTVFVDGSFITEKPIPGDFDACWDPTNVDPDKLDPILLDFSEMRKRQKEKYRGEFFPATVNADGERDFAEYFQIDKHTGNQKGIVRIRFTTTQAEERQ